MYINLIKVAIVSTIILTISTIITAISPFDYVVVKRGQTKLADNDNKVKSFLIIKPFEMLTMGLKQIEQSSHKSKSNMINKANNDKNYENSIDNHKKQHNKLKKLVKYEDAIV